MGFSRCESVLSHNEETEILIAYKFLIVNAALLNLNFTGHDYADISDVSIGCIWQE